MKIQDIKKLNILCPTCKVKLNFSDNGNIFKIICIAPECQRYFFIEGLTHNTSEIKTCTFFLNRTYGFYCDDYNFYNNSQFDNWIIMNNENFFNLLLKYSEINDFNFIEEKHKTLVLFQ